MNGHHLNGRALWGDWLWRMSLAILAVIAFLIFSSALEQDLGIRWETTYRISCAGACIAFIYNLAWEHRGEQWLRISLWVILFANIGIFLTPLVDRPTSRGELMLFALPDAVIVLTARVVSYRVADVHQRAKRQTMILALIVAVVFCVGVLGLEWSQGHRAQTGSVQR